MKMINCSGCICYGCLYKDYCYDNRCDNSRNDNGIYDDINSKDKDCYRRQGVSHK